MLNTYYKNEIEKMKNEIGILKNTSRNLSRSPLRVTRVSLESNQI